MKKYLSVLKRLSKRVDLRPPKKQKALSNKGFFFSDDALDVKEEI